MRSAPGSRGRPRRRRARPDRPSSYFNALCGVDVPGGAPIVKRPLPDDDDSYASGQVFAEAEHGWWCHGCPRGGRPRCSTADLLGASCVGRRLGGCASLEAGALVRLAAPAAHRARREWPSRFGRRAGRRFPPAPKGKGAPAPFHLQFTPEKGLETSPRSCRINARREARPTEMKERDARGVGEESGRGLPMTEHAVVIAGGGPTGLTLAGELALAGVDVAIVERRASQDLAGSRAGGLHSRTIEVLDQRGIADRFLSQGQVAQVAGFAWVRLDISDFPTRHNYGLALWQNHIERILAGWVGELAVTVYRGREGTGLAQDDTRVDVQLSDGESLRAEYLVGCDGGRSVVRKGAGIDFPGWDPSTSSLIAEVEMDQQPEWGPRRDDKGIHSLSRLEGRGASAG